MRKTFRLNTGTPSTSIDIDFEAVAVVVNNPTASPVFLRIGSPDIPTETNADLFIPSGESLSFPVSGYSFAATFGTATALPATSVALSGLFTTCIITFLGAGETIPSYGSASFLTLSISELRAITAYAGVTTSPTFDIGAWGGALIYVNPGAASGQAVVAVNVSNTGLAGSFTPLGVYAIWPNVPSVITVPRVARYFQVILNATAIPGEAAISGSYSVRASLEEVQTLTYNPSGNTITKSYTMTAVQAVQYLFVVVGLPAVSIAAIATAGTGAASAITFLVEASSDLINWRQVTARDQKMSAGVTLYRALGNLDIFIRVSIFEIGGAAQNGTLYVSTPREVDTGYILNTIQQSLGDISAPTNTNQDIYHELDNIRLNAISTVTNLATIITQLGAINVNLTTVNTNLVTIQGQLSTINTNITAVNTAIAASNVQLTSINTATATLQAAQTRSAITVTGQVAINVAVYVNAGLLFVAGSYITWAQVTCRNVVANPLAAFVLQMAVGTAVAVTAQFYSQSPAFYALPGAAGTHGTCQPQDYGSIRSPGYIVPVGSTYLWVLCSDGAAIRPYVADYSLTLVQ